MRGTKRNPANIPVEMDKTYPSIGKMYIWVPGRNSWNKLKTDLCNFLPDRVYRYVLDTNKGKEEEVFKTKENNDGTIIQYFLESEFELLMYTNKPKREINVEEDG